VPDSDQWPDEPDEPDPESRWGDPERDLVSVPEVDVPGEGENIAVDGDLAKFFWVTVIYANVAVAGVSVGAMLVAFRGQWIWGGVAVAVGLFALFRTYDLYGTYREQVAGDDPESDAEVAGDDPESDAEAADSDEHNG